MNHTQTVPRSRGGRFTDATPRWIAGLICGAAFSAHGAAPEVIEGRLLVKPRARLSEATVQSVFSAHGARQQGVINAINVRILNVPPARQAAITDALNRHRDIEFAEPDYLLEPDATPNDAQYSSQWHLPRISAPLAWDTTTGGNAIIIAILDSGIDVTHPDLASLLVPGWNFYDNNSNLSDVTGHGTAVAGTAIADGNNGIGVAGVAWDGRIMPLRIADTNGYASSSAAANALTWAADHGARVANISYGNVTKITAIISAAQYFQSRGGVVTASSGNSGIFDSTPDSPHFLLVSATDANDALPSWSNTGNNVDLAAPGVNIGTTMRGGGYGNGSGTSFAAPIVAGVAALVISANPALSAAQAAAPADGVPPTASITSPTSGSTVSGVVNVNVSATDSVGVTRIDCYLNGALACSGTTDLSWDTAA